MGAWGQRGSGAEWLRQVSMEGGAALVKTASIRERAGSARALQILQEEEEEERRLSLELAEVQEEIAALAVAEPASADPGWQTKKKKKRKRRRRKGSAGTPAAETPTAAASAAAAAEEGTRAALVHTRSQIADLARVLSRPAGAAAETAEQAALARTRSQIAALRSTLSLDAAAEAAAAAEVAVAEGLSEEQQNATTGGSQQRATNPRRRRGERGPRPGKPGRGEPLSAAQPQRRRHPPLQWLKHPRTASMTMATRRASCSRRTRSGW